MLKFSNLLIEYVEILNFDSSLHRGPTGYYACRYLKHEDHREGKGLSNVTFHLVGKTILQWDWDGKTIMSCTESSGVHLNKSFHIPMRLS